MGANGDTDPERRKPENACYFMKDRGFDCYGSGLLNMAPCKVKCDLPSGAHIALSLPCFYQVSSSFCDNLKLNLCFPDR